MRNICLTVAYDGTNYHGFQRQPEFHGPTIQGKMEAVWQELTGENVRIYTAGRTDTGVHAAGQVVNFASDCRIPNNKIPKAFNSLLPYDIRVLAARDEQEDFNARRSAVWKRYDYVIENSSIYDVMRRLYVLHEPIPLDLAAMQEAVTYFEGRHNFRAFAAAGGSSKTFERTLYCCRVRPEGVFIRVVCIGDGFLYNMVRIIVGTLLKVGKGKLSPREIPVVLTKGNRPLAGQTAPAHGLTLMHVHYQKESPFAVFPELEQLGF